MTVKLIILPHAGGASYAYQKLAQALSPRFEIYCHDLPGHGPRASEPLMETMEELSCDLQQKIGSLDEQSWAVFGHSMGALLAHDLIQSRHSRGHSLPFAFLASGTASPSTKTRSQVSDLPSDLFWSRIQGYGGIPADALKMPEFKAYFETLLRSDFSIVESYIPGQGALEVPIHVFYGQEDMSAKEADSWRDATQAETHCHPFEGGHFFLFDRISEISERICHVLGDAGKRICNAP